VDRLGSALIDFTETVYDLDEPDDRWLANVLEAGFPVLNRGLGVAGALFARPPSGGDVEVVDLQTLGCPDDFAERHLAALESTPPEVLFRQSRPGQAGTMSYNTRDYPEELAHYVSYVPYCKDLLGVTAADPNGVGAAIIAPLEEVMTLSGRAKERWQMIGAHMIAGHRLRHRLSTEVGADENLPYEAEAIVDPESFRVLEAAGDAQGRTARERLREAAIRVDRSRGRLRRTDPQKALRLWTALVKGRWSLIDWFDTDARRFMLAVPNPPDVTDPRGLTERETQVVAYAVLGLTNKMIAYYLGISTSRVSALLRSAMRKLGVYTRGALVKLFQDLQSLKGARETGF